MTTIKTNCNYKTHKTDKELLEQRKHILKIAKKIMKEDKELLDRLAQ